METLQATRGAGKTCRRVCELSKWPIVECWVSNITEIPHFLMSFSNFRIGITVRTANDEEFAWLKVRVEYKAVEGEIPRP